MERQSVSPLKLFRSAKLHRHLLWSLAKRETTSRYKESLFGLLWSILSPLLMLTIFSFVFTNIFKSRWGVTVENSEISYPIILFAGLIVFNFFSECLGKSPFIVMGNQNFVKKIIFPLEILPLVSILSALFQSAISFCILLVFILVETGTIPWTALLLPIGMLPFLIFILGMMFWLSATGVFVRDISQTVGLITTGMMFISPIFFPSSSFPEHWQFLAHYNPLTYPIELARDLLVFGVGIEIYDWLKYLGFSLAFCWLGYAWFQKLRIGFSDVL